MTQAANLGALGTNAGTTGILASAGMPAGSVLQAVTTNYQTYTSSTSTSLVDVSGFSASITPKFSTSKILILLDINGFCNAQSSGASSIIQVYITDGSNNVIAKVNYGYVTNGGASGNWLSLGLNYSHSPATTSAITYKIRMQGDGSGNGWSVNNYATGGSVTSGITLLEIAS